MSKISFSTGALYILETVDAFACLRKAGFENAELMPQCQADLSLKSLSEFDRTGIHISSIHYPLAFFALLYNANPGMCREGRAFADNLALFAKKAGTSIVVVHTESEYTGLMKTLVGDVITANLRYLSACLEEAGVTVAMENHPEGVGQKPDTLDSYVQKLAIPNMKIMVDTTEVIEGGGDPYEFIRDLKDTVCHLHLSDFANGTKHLPIGTGDINWKKLFELLKQRDYSGYYTLEPSYRHYLEDIDSKLRRDYDFISSLV
ncbi:MAG: sugar phosphate isomerase/epimerase family protein [Sphaerochaetaceae bacterium]